jgi:hypothetical protein
MAYRQSVTGLVKQSVKHKVNQQTTPCSMSGNTAAVARPMDVLWAKSRDGEHVADRASRRMENKEP